MNTFTSLSIFLAGAALSACSSTTTTSPPAAVPTNIGGQASHVGSTYSATQAGVLTDIQIAPSRSGRALFWNQSSNNILIRGYESASVLAIGGYNGGAVIKGISGTLTTTPLTGTATYTGRYLWGNGARTGFGDLGFDVDFAAGTFADNAIAGSIPFRAVGTINGAQFVGTVTIYGNDMPLEGGFFGTNEMVGVFSNASTGGIIYGTAP